VNFDRFDRIWAQKKTLFVTGFFCIVSLLSEDAIFLKRKNTHPDFALVATE
jgi:hypothetical protein